jgi:intracellular sulfur oxidation DsrE/DsrF family protein
VNLSSHRIRALSLVFATLFSASAIAADSNNANPNPMTCPIGSYWEPESTLSMDDEFGYGSQAMTQCLRERHHAKVVISVSHPFMFDFKGAIRRAPDGKTTFATFLSNLDHLTRNYENVHGMTIGKDVEVVVVFLESGGVLATTQHGVFAQVDNQTGVAPNPFVQLVQAAQAKGIKFYLCQTAARNLKITRASMIPGIEFVPGGHIAVADFQMQGYAVINP